MMSATVGRNAFVGLVAQADTEVLKGSAAQKPLGAGDMIIAHGTYTDGGSTGPGIFLILRQVDAKVYEMVPFGSNDKDWSKWLRDKNIVRAVLWGNESDPIPEEHEMLRRWLVVSKAGERPQRSDYEDFGKKVADGILPKWSFANEMMVSQRAAPQAVTVPFFGKRV